MALESPRVERKKGTGKDVRHAALALSARLPRSLPRYEVIQSPGDPARQILVQGDGGFARYFREAEFHNHSSACGCFVFNLFNPNPPF
jgi:hypothetical protein